MNISPGTSRRRRFCLRPDFTIIIPAYNEEARIEKILSQTPGSGGHYRIICDGRDSTAAIVMSFASAHPDIDLQCLVYPRRLGKGGAVREGFSSADTPYVGFMDADASTSVEQMIALFDELEQADCVVGSRWLPGSLVPEPQGIARTV